MTEGKEYSKAFLISAEQKARCDRLMPWGIGKHLMRWALDGLLDTMEEHPNEMRAKAFDDPGERPRIVFLPMPEMEEERDGD